MLLLLRRKLRTESMKGHLFEDVRRASDGIVGVESKRKESAPSCGRDVGHL